MTEPEHAGKPTEAAELEAETVHLDSSSPILVAKFRSANGSTLDLPVLDISAAGCLVERTFRALQEGERVLIRLPGLTYMPAQVVWIEDHTAGITFEQTLHEAVLRHLKDSGARSARS